VAGGNGSKPRAAFFDFASCEGCQLTVVDCLQTQLDLLSAVDIVQFREAMSERLDDYQIAFVEGGCTRPSDEERLKTIRAQAAIVIALGACAHIGGVNAVRYGRDPDEVRRTVYGNDGDIFETGEPRPIGAVIPVDGILPGCPIDRDEFIRAVRTLLQGRLPKLPEEPVCVECKLRENACLVLEGQVCLGSISRAGCGAICPTFGTGCEGCRGLVPEANLPALRQIFGERGIEPEAVEAALGLFLRRELALQEARP
jgi:coenzyme F420-reducing hydrogenase gamma subunit